LSSSSSSAAAVRRKVPSTLAVCNSDGGWLNSTAVCSARSSSAAACVAAVRAAEPSSRTQDVCGCIARACRTPGQAVGSEGEGNDREDHRGEEEQDRKKQGEAGGDAEKSAFGGDSSRSSSSSSSVCEASARPACHAACWSDARSSCADTDDLQSACVFFCEDYCVSRACGGAGESRAGNEEAVAPEPGAPTEEEKEEEEEEEEEEKEEEAAAAEEEEEGGHETAACTRGCARTHMDPTWKTPHAVEHFSDYAMCRLQC
jgi:hypothetical protein